MSKRHNILPTRASFNFQLQEILRERMGVQNKVFRVTISLLMTHIKMIYTYAVVFNIQAILYF